MPTIKMALTKKAHFYRVYRIGQVGVGLSTACQFATSTYLLPTHTRGRSASYSTATWIVLHLVVNDLYTVKNN